jgi:hypothetical protein
LKAHDLTDSSLEQDFDKSGHLNEGGNFDAYYRVNGNFLANNAYAHNTTSFDVTLGAHAVLLGQDVNVLSIEANAQTDSGALSPQGNSFPSASGNLAGYVFGTQFFNQSLDSLGVGFDKPLEADDSVTLEAQIWIFDLKFTATGSAGVDITGNLNFAGAAVQVLPHATIGLSAFGGISIGIASGGVQVTIPRLLDAKVVAAATLTWAINTDPSQCNTTLNFNVLVTADIESDGGDISLTATFGVCPFCYGDSHSIFSWGPLLSSAPKILFQYGISAKLFSLPNSACEAPLSVFITSPAAGTGLPANTPFGLVGGAVAPNFGSIPCAELTWSLSAGGAFIPSGANTGCSTKAIFANAGPATVTLSATHTFPKFSESNAVSASINVTPLAQGVYIQSITEPGNKLHTLCDVTPCSSSSLSIIQPVAGTYNLVALMNGATQPTCTSWTAVDGSGNTATLVTDPASLSTFPYTVAQWTPVPPPSVASGTYTITVSTAGGACGSGGTTFGSTQLQVTFEALN